MNWILGIAMLGLGGVALEIYLDFLKQAKAIRDEQRAKQQKIEVHRRAIEEATTDAEGVTKKVGDIEVELKTVKKSISETRAEIRGIEEKERRLHPTRHHLEDAEGGQQ